MLDNRIGLPLVRFLGTWIQDTDIWLKRCGSNHTNLFTTNPSIPHILHRVVGKSKAYPRELRALGGGEPGQGANPSQVPTHIFTHYRQFRNVK